MNKAYRNKEISTMIHNLNETNVFEKELRDNQEVQMLLRTLASAVMYDDCDKAWKTLMTIRDMALTELDKRNR